MFEAIQPYLGILYALALSLIYATVAWKLSYEKFSEMKFARSVLATFVVALGLSATGIADVYSTTAFAPILGLFMSKGLNYLKTIPVETKYTLDELTQVLIPIVTQQAPGEVANQNSQTTNPPAANNPP